MGATQSQAAVALVQIHDWVSGNDAASDNRTAELVALYHWYRDWVEFVKRKDYRVQLGIAAKHKATDVTAVRTPVDDEKQCP